MTVDQLATVVFNDISTLSMWLIAFVMIFVVAFAYALYKINSHEKTIESLKSMIRQIEKKKRY